LLLLSEHENSHKGKGHTLKKVLGVGLIMIAVLVIVVGVWHPWSGTATQTSAASKQLKTIKAVIGSEKKEFFNDPAVQKVFAQNGYRIEVDTAGSREIATTKDLQGYDFAFPSSAPAAQKLMQKTGASTSYSPFYSPMVVATWKPVIQLLAKNGVASQDANGIWQIDMQKYLDIVNKDTRWKDLNGADTLYNSPRSVLISSTDIRKSNSAAMYLTVASYVLNDYNVVTTPEQQKTVLPTVSKLFLNQGFSGSSSDEPFRDYLSQGSGSSPLVMVYEAQLIGEKITQKDLPSDAVIAYMSPTVFSKHIVVPLDKNGDAVGKLLVDNAKLQELAAKHGFRTNSNDFKKVVTANKIQGVQDNLVNVAETPSYDVLESLIADISKEY
jgi:hypothetical protein